MLDARVRAIGVSLLWTACTAADPGQAAPAGAVKPAEPVKPAELVKPVEKPAEPVLPAAPVSTPVVAGSPTEIAATLQWQAPRFMFVFRGRVALTPTADEAWGVGPTRRTPQKEAVEGTREVDLKRLPEALAALAGATVRMYGPKGPLCTARLATPTLYGYQQGSEIPTPEDADELPSQPALMAAYTPVEGRCEGALWARGAALPEPIVLAPVARPDAKLVARVWAAAKQEAGVTGMAAAYAEYARDAGARESWEKFVARTLRVGVWRAGATPAIAVLEIGDAENVRCSADFSESLSLVYLVDGESLPLLSSAGPWRPASLLRARDSGDSLEAIVPPSNRLGGILLSDFEVVGELRFPSEEDC